jgi:hypothetical protein
MGKNSRAPAPPQVMAWVLNIGAGGAGRGGARRPGGAAAALVPATAIMAIMIVDVNCILII